MAERRMLATRFSAVLLAAAVAGAGAAVPQPVHESSELPEQVTIPRIEQLTTPPNAWDIIDWRAKAEKLHRFLFATEATVGVDVFFNVSLTSAWYNGSVASMPSYLGEANAAHGAGEGLAVIGSVYGSSVIGKDKDSFTLPAEFITVYADPHGIVWNNPNGMRPAPQATFWYGLMNSFMLYSTMDLLQLPVRHQMLQSAAKRWGEASKVMGGNWSHTGFSFKTMQPIDNGRWTEGDAAAGVALLAVWCAETSFCAPSIY
jgi:hypothetical protein